MNNNSYVDPELVALHDQLNADERDLLFYLQQVGAEPKRVLDLGCGTGVLAVRLAQAGHTVTAVDPAAAMLNLANRRSGSENVLWVHNDIEALAEDPAFDVIVMTGHAFQCLLTDQVLQATLSAVRAQLFEGGKFVFETRNPATRPWLEWTPEKSRRLVRDKSGNPVTVFHELLAKVGELVSFRTYYRFETHQVISDQTLRFPTWPTLERHLLAAGFVVTSCIGDWTGDELTTSSPEIIVSVTASDPVPGF